MKYLTLLGVTDEGIVRRIATLKLPLKLSDVCTITAKTYGRRFDWIVFCFRNNIAEASRPKIDLDEVMEHDFGFFFDQDASFGTVNIPETIPFCYQSYAILGERYYEERDKVYSLCITDRETSSIFSQNGVFFYSARNRRLKSYASMQVLSQYRFSSADELKSLLLQIQSRICQEKEIKHKLTKFKRVRISLRETVEEVYSKYKNSYVTAKIGELSIDCHYNADRVNFPLVVKDNRVVIKPGCIDHCRYLIGFFEISTNLEINLTLYFLRNRIIRIWNYVSRMIVFEEWSKIKDLTLEEVIEQYGLS